MKVQNKGGKGNPNHSDVTGEFVSADEVSTNSEEKSIDSNDFGIFQLDFDLDSIDSFLNSINILEKEEREQLASEVLDKISKSGFVNLDAYSSYSREDKMSLILNSEQEYDKESIKDLSDKELDALIFAEAVLNSKQQLEQKKILAEKEKNQISEDEKAKINVLYTDFYNKYKDKIEINGVWYGSIDITRFKEKTELSGLTNDSAIDRKKKYYQEIIDDPFGLVDEVEEAQSKLNKLNEWEKIGKEYLEEVKKINNEFSVLRENAEQKLFGLNQEFQKYNGSDFLEVSKFSTDFISKYQDKNAPYSPLRKKQATWITPSWIKNNGYSGMAVYEASIKHFGNKFEKMWQTMSSSERNQLIDYTGGGYSKYNRPLRGLSHSGWAGWDFSNGVTLLTNAIDKCVWDEDIWVQRGVGSDMKFQLPGGGKITNLYNMSESELQSLVGTSFKDNGFYSAGAGKGTGFSSQDIILNTYCPKGTKMAYMNTKGHYSYGGENEMILQRGYSYRITKVEKKGSKYYLDVEVILDSDKDKITSQEELSNLSKKYLK